MEVQSPESGLPQQLVPRLVFLSMGIVPNYYAARRQDQKGIPGATHAIPTVNNDDIEWPACFNDRRTVLPFMVKRHVP